MTPLEFLKSICDAGDRIANLGYVGATEGNISARNELGEIVITPNGKNKGALHPSDLVNLSAMGEHIHGHRPSSELYVHKAIYAARPDCGAIIHTHSPYATTFAMANVTIPTDTLGEAFLTLGEVALVPFFPPGSKALGEAVGVSAATHNAILMANHGPVVLGRTVREALHRMEILERVAMMHALSRLIGEPVPFTESEKEALTRSTKPIQ